MNCAYSEELLALDVEGDLPNPLAEEVRRHLVDCEACRRFRHELEACQSLFKSLGKDTASLDALAGVRRQVLSQIGDVQETLGWAVKIERLILYSFRRPRYAIAVIAGLVVVSVSLIGQIRYSKSGGQMQAAVFEGKDTLLLPEGYRKWIFVGSSTGLSYSNNPASAQSHPPEFFHNVYINPAAYRDYASTGEFPEGTVMILEMTSGEIKKEAALQGTYEKDFVGLEASVKDSSRFGGGWGYFGFMDSDGKLKSKAQVLPEKSGCRSCHEQRAETDHVFTQFYPALKSVRS